MKKLVSLIRGNLQSNLPQFQILTTAMNKINQAKYILLFIDLSYSDSEEPNEHQTRNNNQNGLMAVIESKNDRLTHFCRPGETLVRAPSDLRAPQQRQLFCKTHAVKTKCVLKSCSDSHNCHPQDDDVQPAKHKALNLKDLSRQQVLVLLVLALGNFLSFCSMAILAPFFPKEVRYIY